MREANRLSTPTFNILQRFFDLFVADTGTVADRATPSQFLTYLSQRPPETDTVEEAEILAYLTAPEGFLMATGFWPFLALSGRPKPAARPVHCGVNLLVSWSDGRVSAGRMPGGFFADADAGVSSFDAQLVSLLQSQVEQLVEDVYTRGCAGLLEESFPASAAAFQLLVDALLQYRSQVPEDMRSQYEHWLRIVQLFLNPSEATTRLRLATDRELSPAQSVQRHKG